MAYNPIKMAARGGTITVSGSYRIHTFKSNGVFVPHKSMNVEVLVVAGGGGGGRYGGGGGAGGLIYNASYAVSLGEMAATVGAGGIGWVGDAQSGGTAGNGMNSTFGSLTAIGGGGGGNYRNISGNTAGANGGSGGGAGMNATASGGAATSGQGNIGGSTTGPYGSVEGGGGGGAGAAGGLGNDASNGKGGVGLAYSISGSSIYYSGGGSGGQLTTTILSGGLGGGGSGTGPSAASATACDATPNTGGGGGANCDVLIGGVYRAGNGGSGIVIIRYPLSEDIATTPYSIEKRKKITINTTTATPANYQVKLIVPFVPEMNIDFSDLRFTTKDKSAWKRKTVTITAGASTLLVGYQVKLVIPKETEMQTDFRDIRFETANGRMISYWLESVVSTTATVWIKLNDAINASGTDNIYMYYGNPYVSSASNGTNVFEFFDDFTYTDIVTNHGWSVIDGTAPTPSGSKITLSTSWIYYTRLFGTNYAMRGRGKMSSTTVTQEWGFSTKTTYGLGDIQSAQYSVSMYANYIGILICNFSASYTQSIGGAYTTEYNIFEIVRNSTTNTQFTHDGTSYNNSPIATNVPTQDMYIHLLGAAGQTGSSEWDWVLVRKYISPEPATPTIASIATDVQWNPNTIIAVLDHWLETSTYQAATGGTVTTSGGYRVHTFTADGTFVANKSMNVEVLVVAGGGGGGGGTRGGGGGAGGLIYNASKPISSGNFSVVIGSGGARGTFSTTQHINTIGVAGGNSSFSDLTAIGGGYGSASDYGTAGSGGSGGGSWYLGTAGTGTSGQGNSGGVGSSVAWFGSGGGGGAEAVGTTGTGSIGGNGGNGLQYSISGTATYYAGGGAGAVMNSSATGTPGLGGGGSGDNSVAGGATAAITNTGGGGGANGNGGSGIVIIRYPITEDNVGIVWVELADAINANGSDYIYMHYGNPNLTSTSNGSNAFDLFDEFSSGSTPDSNIWNITGAVTISNGLLVTTADNIRVNSKTTWTTPIILKYSARNTSSGGASYSRHGLIYGSNTITASVHQIGVQDDGGSGAAGWYTDFYLTSLDQVSRGSSNTSFHTYIITWNPGVLASIQRDGGTVYTGQIPSGAQALNVMLGDKDTEVEYVQVRKYVAIEPTIDQTAIPEAMNTFTRRKKLTINNNSGGALTDYQVPVTIAYTPVMKTNFDDLRFVDSVGNLLPYWIESVTNAIPAATGGTVTTSGGYRTHTFTAGGTFTPAKNMNVEVFAWGGGGAGGTVGGWSYGSAGGAGGAANGIVNVTATPYEIVVGGGGVINSYPTGAVGGGGAGSNNNSDNRYSGGGGGYSGIFITSVSQANARIIAGGGGGGSSACTNYGAPLAAGGAGGGSSGQIGYTHSSYPADRGNPGTQSAAGADAYYSVINGGGGQGALQGGTTKYTSYGGGGGGGYWGGSAGGYNNVCDGMGGGGGGSGYYNPSFVSGTLTAGSGTTPGDSTNILRGTAGIAGAVAGNGSAGIVIIRYKIIEDIATTGTTALVWIKCNLPNYVTGGVSTTGDNTVYMYYGNQNAASASDSFYVDVFGNGSSGALVVSSANTIINNYTYLTGNENSGDNTIVVNSGTNFSNGDDILIIQMKDATGNLAGTYEYKKILSGGGTTTLVLTTLLQNSYTSVTQVVRIPQYTSVTVNSGASITASAWDGNKGGIVVLRATGTVSIAGSITVNDKGFLNGETYKGNTMYGGGGGGGGGGYESGGGYGGYAGGAGGTTGGLGGAHGATGPAGRGGAGGNGGGSNGGIGGSGNYTPGSNCGGGGGGGGGGGNFYGLGGLGGGTGGHGACAGGTVGIDGGSSTGTNSSAGNGGGGYGTNGGGGKGAFGDGSTWPGYDGTATSGGNGNVGGYSGGGISHSSCGSGGGAAGLAYGVADLSKIYLGTSGGNVAANTGAGGIVIILAKTILVTGTISSNGSNASGQIGGSSGGSIYIVSNNATIGSNLITATGGTGVGTPGGGGAGGSGRICIYTNVLSGTTNPTAYSAIYPPSILDIPTVWQEEHTRKGGTIIY